MNDIFVFFCFFFLKILIQQDIIQKDHFPLRFQGGESFGHGNNLIFSDLLQYILLPTTFTGN